MMTYSNWKRQLLALAWFLSCHLLVSAEEIVSFNPALPEGAICSVKIADLHPTQFAVGKREVDLRSEKIAKMKPGKLQKYLAEHRATIVIGPQGAPYITDGHHICGALVQSKLSTTIEAKVAANLQKLSPAEFWATMKKNGWAYLYDEKGSGPLNPDRLPRTIAELKDDPYRSLAWVVRERGGMKKSPADFSEFQWAQFFRNRLKIEDRPGGFEKAVEQALAISHSPEAKNLPGYIITNSNTSDIGIHPK
jgi:hypothetical protein